MADDDDQWINEGEEDADVKHRSYSFTLNNYTDEEVEKTKLIHCKYLIFGKEVGEKCGTPHLQGCIVYTNPVSWRSCHKKIPRAYLKVTKSQSGSIKYCRKEGDVFEKGTPPSPGKRTDIDKVREILNEGGNMRTVVATAQSIQSIRMAEIHLKYFEKKRNWKPIVRWFYGPTGTGKSRQAYADYDEHDPYVAMSTGRWFEGYDAHSYVIIDDMRRDFMKFHELLRMLDRYAFMVECKGGSRQFVATHITITSCYHPEMLFDTREDVGQLLRRLDEIREFP